MKDSFILYNSFYEPIKSLKNEQLGKLLRAIFDYTINGVITQDNDIIVAFMFIKNQIDLDTKKWEEEKAKRSEAGKKGMQNRWHNKNNNVITKDNKDNSVINVITNITDNVNENVNVNDNKKENIKRKKFKKPTLEEVINYCEERNNNVDAQKFIDFYEANNWTDSKGNKVKSWKQKIITWEGQRVKEKKEQLPEWFNKEIKKEKNENEQELKDMLKEFE